MIFLGRPKPWEPDVGHAGSARSIPACEHDCLGENADLANNAPPYIRSWFDWNPLFHTIDQGRGFIFLNYTPRFTSIDYPIYYGLVCVMIGLMAEFFTRQHASASWNKRR